MADHKINVPASNGNLTVNEGDTLLISASTECTFSCSFGECFSPSLNGMQLTSGENGPYVAQQAGSGDYRTTIVIEAAASAMDALSADAPDIHSVQVPPA